MVTPSPSSVVVDRRPETPVLPQSEINAFMADAMSGDYDHLLATCMRWFEVE